MAAEKPEHPNTALGFQSLLWQIGDQIGVGEHEKKKMGLSEEVLRSFLHDIKSPLSVVGLLRPRIEKWDGEAAELLVSALNQIECLSKRLREIPRTESERTPAPTQSLSYFPAIELGSYLTELMKTKSLEHKGRGVFLASSHGLSEECHLPGELGEWQSMLSNLVNNSVESSSDFSRVRVEMRIHNGELSLKVQDSGSGLTDSQLKSFNAGITWSSKGSGRGYGLKQTIEYVERKGGKVLFKNNPSGGLSVAIQLKIKQG